MIGCCVLGAEAPTFTRVMPPSRSSGRAARRQRVRLVTKPLAYLSNDSTNEIIAIRLPIAKAAEINNIPSMSMNVRLPTRFPVGRSGSSVGKIR